MSPLSMFPGIGRWPGPSWVPYAADAPVNTQITATPTLWVDSATAVTLLNAHTTRGGLNNISIALGGTGDFNVPVYYAKQSDPLYTVSITNVFPGASAQMNGAQIHCPDYAVPATGSDGHMVIVDPELKYAYEGSFGVIDTTAKTLSFGWGIKELYRGTGLGGRAFAARTGSLGGLLRASELAAATVGNFDTIHHALQLLVPTNCEQSHLLSTPGLDAVWPSIGGQSNGTGVRGASMGSLIQLNWTDAYITGLFASTGIVPWQAAIYKALAKYGGYVVDGGGAWALRVEDDLMYSTAGISAPLLAFATLEGGSNWMFPQDGPPATFYAGIIGANSLTPAPDWSKFQIIDPVYWQGVCQANMVARRINPGADISNPGSCTKTQATLYQSLARSDGTYNPFTPANVADAVGGNAGGGADKVCTVAMASYSVPAGQNLTGLAVWVYVATAASATVKVETVVSTDGGGNRGSITVPVNQAAAWYVLDFSSLVAADLANAQLRLSFQGTGASSVYCAYFEPLL